MSTFKWNGDTLPLPKKFSLNSADEWFLQMAELQDRMRFIDKENLEPMTDEDGNDLDMEEVLLISEYGFKNGGHYEAYRGWGMSYWAEQTGEDLNDLMFRASTLAQERLTQKRMQSMSGAGGALSPVDGVSLQQWAGVQAGLAGGKDLGAMLKGIGCDQAKWDKVSAEWMTRMSTDTTGAIATAYAQAFAGGSTSQYAGAAQATSAQHGKSFDTGAEPMSLERYVEIQEAMSAASNRGEDVNALLGKFGLNAADWGMVGMYWSKKIYSEATKYHALFTQYSDKYRAKYAG